MNSDKDVWQLACIIFILYFVLLPMCRDKSDDKKYIEDEGKIKAFYMSQKFVQQQLKAVSTAEFPEYSEGDVQSSTDGYRVTSYVDAENSFGAKLRTNYVCKLHKIGERWYLDGLRYY